MRTSQEDRWEQNLATVKQFIEEHKSLPSKYRIEEHRMLNWIKYNRKLIAQGKLLPARQEKFEQLLAAAADYHKINQYSYISGQAVLTKKKKDDKELTLF